MLFGTPRLRSGPGRLPFGCSVLMLLPVFCRARRAPGLARDCRLEAILAFTKLFGPLSFVAFALEVVLFALGPLTSGLFVFAAFLLALLKFERGWSTARRLSRGGLFDFRLRLLRLSLLRRFGGQRNGACKNNSFGTA